MSSVPPLSAALPLQVEKVSLPSAVLANGGNVSFSMPEACLDCGDGDIIIGEELDELLDSVPDPDESVMVRLVCFLSQMTILMSGDLYLYQRASSEVPVNFPSYVELDLCVIGLIFSHADSCKCGCKDTRTQQSSKGNYVRFVCWKT